MRIHSFRINLRLTSVILFGEMVCESYRGDDVSPGEQRHVPVKLIREPSKMLVAPIPFDGERKFFELLVMLLIPTQAHMRVAPIGRAGRDRRRMFEETLCIKLPVSSLTEFATHHEGSTHRFSMGPTRAPKSPKITWVFFGSEADIVPRRHASIESGFATLRIDISWTTPGK